MSVRSRFQGKRILMTGTTGFLGKVLLQKVLYSLNCVNKIYVLIRAKQGSNLQERFKKEIISSPCFQRLRNLYKSRFDQFIQDKVLPIQGDLLKEDLGLSKYDQDDLIQNCHVIINCAASVDFNSRLDKAIDSNIKGSLRMLQLARKIKNLDIFTHISTCYVNCDRKGLIKEQIYQKNQDPEEQLQYLQSIPIEQLATVTTKILGHYPNTYTFSKNLCERIMKKRKGNVPLCFVRPAIINTSYSEPFPGWIDSIAAAAALYLFVGLGIIKQLRGNLDLVADTVPVDSVVATIIVASAYNMGNQQLPIYHSGSSDRNPKNFHLIKEEVIKFWNTNISQSKIGKASIVITQNSWKLQLKKLKRKLPLAMYQRLSPLLGSTHIKNAQRMAKTMNRGQQIVKIFQFFMVHQWIFECKNFQKLWQFLTPEQRKQYLIDISQVDMRKYLQFNNYGIQKYILKQNAELPSVHSNLLRFHSEDDYFADLKWAYTTKIPINTFNRKSTFPDIKFQILSSNRVTKAIQQWAEKQCQNSMISIEKAKIEALKQAQKIISQLISEVKIPVIRAMAYTLHKAFKSIYEKININMDMLQTIRKIQSDSQIPIVLLPTHRSYLDFLIVGYIFFIYKLRLPNFISDQALLQAQFFPYLIRKSGSFFFLKNKYKHQPLYHIIFDKYVELLLMQGNTLQFFIEGTRSRTGKILDPRFDVLNIVLDTLIYNKVKDVCLIPMTINYQKVLEGDTFPAELLGQEKVAESLLRVIKASPILRFNYGRVYVQISEPIMTKKIIDEVKLIENAEGKEKTHQFRIKLLKRLGKQIIGKMTNGIVVMSTAIVSSVLLMHRKGISQQALIKMVNQLAKYILKKGYKVGGVNENSSAVAVRNAIGFLSGITTKSKKNIFELTISAGDQFQKLLMLSYYRNMLTHAFLPQAFIGCALSSFGQQLNSNEGVSLARVHEQTLFLMSLLREEYYIQYSLQKYSDFMNIIQQMQDNSIVQLKSTDKIIICPSGVRMVAFYRSLLKSQIQCYWATLVYIISIARTQQNRYETSSLDKFYDTVQWFMESLYDQKVIEDNQSCSLQLIKNSFDRYQKQKFIKLVPGAKKRDSVVEVLVSLQHLEGFQNSIKFFRKTVHSSILSPIDVANFSLKDLPKL